MNADPLNRWLTPGTNIAVLAGLVGLIVEIRTNTAAVKATDGDSLSQPVAQPRILPN